MQHICEIQCYSVYFHKLCNLGYKNCKSYVQTQQFVIVIWLPLMEHEIPVLPDHLVSIHLPSGAPEFTPGFQWDSCFSIFSFICMFCRSLFVLLYFFFLAIVLSVRLRYTDSNCSFGIFKLFLCFRKRWSSARKSH